MITTAGKLPKRQDGYYDLDRLFPAGRSRCLAVVEHDAAKLIACNQWNPHIITLRKVNGCDANSVVVNPHRFGSVQNHPKGQVPQFLVVGAARSARRNQNMIYDAVRRLHGRGLTNFAVRVVGKLGGEPIPADLSTAINMLGPVSFSRLYQEAEQSDFILTSFQENNADHAFYRTTGTSGAFQLAYGFHRPMILQKSFAEGTPLNSDNALFYGSDDQLFDAMLTAIEMSQADYAHMQTNLTGAVDALWSESLENLRTYINEYSDRFLFR